MPAPPAIRFDKGWKEFKNALSPAKFTPKLQRHVGRATKRNALYAVRQIRQEMKRGVPPRNARLTAWIKGGYKPLVGTRGADLFRSVTHEVLSWDKAVAGVKRTAGSVNVALVVHEGATIKVTDRMRGMFWLLWLASMAHATGKTMPKLTGGALELWDTSKRKKFRPLKDSTKVIRIPKRPFIRYAFQDHGFRSLVTEEWIKAIQLALKSSRKG